MNSKHDIAQYMEEINLALQQDYLQIQSRVKQDPGTAGDQAEETWAEVLRKWLPSHYHIVTKGRVLGLDGTASPQIDILILWPHYPPFLLNKKLYIASGVAAAFECKLTFKLSHLKKLFENAKSLTEITNSEYCKRRNKRKREGGNYSYEEYHRIFDYGLLAHSFEETIKSPSKVTDKIVELDKHIAKHPNQMVDLICVQNLGSWSSEKYAITSAPIVSENNTYSMSYFPFPSTNYTCLSKEDWNVDSDVYNNFSPLGSFIARLYTKLSRTDTSLVPMKEYLVSSLSAGKSSSSRRLWEDLEIPNDLWRLSEVNRNRGDFFLYDFTFLGY
ncbi:DUF6602 domain-containing protein [Psychrobacter aestuarii]|uniref:DUF6602 domain-containing protein n=1 Tax=Psychrobacter aestuarii TaxID=556327 RepID=A0ABN0VLY4_9GAMM|nr:DUF6602 domain-containing protein [Psychrobacter aestuarii]